MPEVLRIDQEPPLKADQRDAWASLARGHATPAQQQRVFAMLVEQLAGTTALEPARLSERESGFLAGRRWVGMVAAKWASAVMWQPIEREENTDDG